MTQRIPENLSTVDWSLVTNMGNTNPPRDPNDDEDEDEDSDTEPDDEREPAVVENPTKTKKATLASAWGKSGHGATRLSSRPPLSSLHDLFVHAVHRREQMRVVHQNKKRPP